MIFAFLLLAAQSAFTVTNSKYEGPVERPASASLVWHDEFDGTALDTRANGSMTQPATSRAGSTVSCNIIRPAGRESSCRERRC